MHHVCWILTMEVVRVMALDEFSTLQPTMNAHRLHSIAIGTVLMWRLAVDVESYAFAAVAVVLLTQNRYPISPWNFMDHCFNTSKYNDNDDDDGGQRKKCEISHNRIIFDGCYNIFFKIVCKRWIAWELCINLSGCERKTTSAEMMRLERLLTIQL